MDTFAISMWVAKNLKIVAAHKIMHNLSSVWQRICDMTGGCTAPSPWDWCQGRDVCFQHRRRVVSWLSCRRRKRRCRGSSCSRASSCTADLVSLNSPSHIPLKISLLLWNIFSKTGTVCRSNNIFGVFCVSYPRKIPPLASRQCSHFRLPSSDWWNFWFLTFGRCHMWPCRMTTRPRKSLSICHWMPPNLKSSQNQLLHFFRKLVFVVYLKNMTAIFSLIRIW